MFFIIITASYADNFFDPYGIVNYKYVTLKIKEDRLNYEIIRNELTLGE